MRDENGNDHARIQGQGQGQEPTEIGNSTIFKSEYPTILCLPRYS